MESDTVTPLHQLRVPKENDYNPRTNNTVVLDMSVRFWISGYLPVQSCAEMKILKNRIYS